MENPTIITEIETTPDADPACLSGAFGFPFRLAFGASDSAFRASDSPATQPGPQFDPGQSLAEHAALLQKDSPAGRPFVAHKCKHTHQFAFVPCVPGKS